MVSSEM